MSRARGVMLAGAYLGLCWGLFCWAAIAAFQYPLPAAGVAETILDIGLWIAMAWIALKLSPVVGRWGRFLPGGDGEAGGKGRALPYVLLALAYVTLYANYYLHGYLIAGVYLASPTGMMLFAGIVLLLCAPLLLLKGGRLPAPPAVWGHLYLLPLLVGGMFVFGRLRLSALSPGSGRLPVALLLYFLISFSFLLLIRYRKPKGRFLLGLVTLPSVLVCVIILGSYRNRFEARVLGAENRIGVAVSSPGAPSVLLISLDTLRPDHLSLFGYRHRTSPHLDAFANDAVVYDRAYSTSSWTLPAHASLFTGLYPIEHGVHYPAGARLGIMPARLSAAAPTVASILASAGYRTAAISANRLAVSPEYDLDRGFQTLSADRRMTDRPLPFTTLEGIDRVIRYPALKRLLRGHENACTITDRSIAWLEEFGAPGEPFFLFLNYLDPHSPYVAPKRFSERKAGLAVGEGPMEVGTLEMIRVLFYSGHARRAVLDSRSRRILRDCYDGEIAYLDDHLGRLFAYLGETGLLDRAWVFIVSDHGEFLGEHERRGHGKALYEEVTRVLLLVRSPGGNRTAGERLDRLTSLVEVPRMILEAAGLEVPPSMMQGAADADSFVVAEKYLTVRDRHYANRDDVCLLRSVWKDARKWIVAGPGETVELFDLREDRGEAVDLAREEKEGERMMRELYDRWRDRMVAAVPGERNDVGADARGEELRALGYLR